MKTTKTIKEAGAFIAVVNSIGEIVQDINKTMLGECMAEVLPEIEDALKGYNRGIRRIQLTTALSDPKTKAVLYDENGNIERSIEGTLDYEEQLYDYLKEHSTDLIEFTPIYCNNLPELPKAVKDALTGFVIKDE